MLAKLPDLTHSSKLDSSAYDGILVVAPKIEDVKDEKVRKSLESYAKIDASAAGGCFVVPSELPAGKIIFSSTGPLDRDYDDVRRFADATEKGIARALSSGCKNPLLYIEESKNGITFEASKLVSILGALKALYVPLEMREGVPEKAIKLNTFGIFVGEDSKLPKTVELAAAIEEGKNVCRDVGGSDPERTAAPRVAEYVEHCFKGTEVSVEVVKGQEVLEKEYPCFAAVNRAASVIPRHDGRVIWLTYTPDGPIEQTLLLVGKGVTYDTGGADIKAGGIMAGMSRDKCGSAVVAGFLQCVAKLKPKGLKVIGAMAMVRNSVGANCYVSDEIITSRHGVRLRVGNTDAEGRMAMVDVLAHAREKALKEKNPHLMTIATLTGHAAVAMGPYTAVMDNGTARKEQFAQKLFATGEKYGDPFEVSNIRREDYKMIFDDSKEFVDVIQCNNAPSTRTPRGHQFPAAFMHHVSGLDKNMATSEHPLKYSHLDIAGSSGGLPHPTTGAAVTALVMHLLHK